MSENLRSLCIHVWSEAGDAGTRIVVHAVEPALDEGDGLPSPRPRFATTSVEEARSHVLDWLEDLRSPGARRGGSRS